MLLIKLSCFKYYDQILFSKSIIYKTLDFVLTKTKLQFNDKSIQQQNISLFFIFEPLKENIFLFIPVFIEAVYNEGMQNGFFNCYCICVSMFHIKINLPVFFLLGLPLNQLLNFTFSPPLFVYNHRPNKLINLTNQIILYKNFFAQNTKHA